MTVIESVKARKIFNSRGSKTIEIEVSTKNSVERIEAPSGASRGSHEVVYYPSGGLDEAIKIVKEVVAPKLVGLDVEKQKHIDQLLHNIDGTDNFSRIGGNTAIAISLAVGKTATPPNMSFFQYLLEQNGVSLPYPNGVSLPYPLGNIIGGGKHAGNKSPDFQEFLALPVETNSFYEAAWANVCFHARAREILEKKDITFTGGKGDEGAWAPNLDNIKALEVMAKASEDTSEEVGVDFRIGVDMASSSFWDEKKEHYTYRRESIKRNAGEQIDYVLNLIRTYKLLYIEDPLHEEDFEGFSYITKKAKVCLICGDDLFTTNPDRLKKGIKVQSGNSIIIKPNQIGTLTETVETIKLAKKASYIPIISHRSGETCDTYLAHLAVGFNCPIIKVGVVGGERIAKINELLRIEECLGEKAKVAELKV